MSATMSPKCSFRMTSRLKKADKFLEISKESSIDLKLIDRFRRRIHTYCVYAMPTAILRLRAMLIAKALPKLTRVSHERGRMS